MKKKLVLVLFGNINAAKLYDYPNIIIPDVNIKDISDYIEIKGFEETKKLLKQLIYG